MIKWVHLAKDYYLGIFLLGIAAIALQELPYMIMPALSLSSNPIMNMSESSVALNVLEKISGILSMALLVLVVRKDDRFFSMRSKNEKLFFSLAVLMISVNFVGWIFYFSGFQPAALMIVCLFAAVPLYYFFIGLWRRNYLLAACCFCFFVIHVLHGCLNLLM